MKTLAHMVKKPKGQARLRSIDGVYQAQKAETYLPIKTNDQETEI